ncbi:MAG TPA: ankyrin repeat domain-containing protein [Gemmataceae bacterium]|nr:ankyrin repeat domain-containing protein [Gemmataceae bacterium]
MPIRFTVGHLAAGSEKFDVSPEEAAPVLRSLLKELEEAGDEHYQVYVVNAQGESLTCYDSGLMEYHPEEYRVGTERYCRPTSFAEAVDILWLHVQQSSASYLPKFTAEAPPPAQSYVWAGLRFPLHVAATSGNLTLLKKLIDAGGDVNQRDESQITPIIYAAREGIYRICKYLVEQGADLTVRDSEGHDLLYCARRRPDIVALFREQLQSGGK